MYITLPNERNLSKVYIFSVGTENSRNFMELRQSLTPVLYCLKLQQPQPHPAAASTEKAQLQSYDLSQKRSQTKPINFKDIGIFLLKIGNLFRGRWAKISTLAIKAPQRHSHPTPQQLP